MILDLINDTRCQVFYMFLLHITSYFILMVLGGCILL